MFCSLWQQAFLFQYIIAQRPFGFIRRRNEAARPLSFSLLKPRARLQAARKQQNDKLTRRRKRSEEERRTKL
jgi:hypothetical protein